MEPDVILMEITPELWSNLKTGSLRSSGIIACKPVEWPIWAKAMKQFSKPVDKGIGDVVARMIGDTNSEAFKMWYLRQFGKICGCAGRQAQWNRQYPLEHETAA